MKKLFLSSCLLLGAMSLSAGVVYVAPNAVGDSTGSSWANAMEDIQAAINIAKQDATGQTEVWVKEGNYAIEKTIQIKDSVNVYGSFAGTETSVEERAKVQGGKAWEFAHPTILDGGDTVSLMKVAKGTLVQPVMINGLVLQHGYNTANSDGGAIRMNDNATLSHCIVRECKSMKNGGGAYFYGGGSIYDCLFENCEQIDGANGGGAITASVTNSGDHTIIIEGCEFIGNRTNVRGGAIATNANNGRILINACTFYNNASIKTVDAVTTLMPGGAIYDNAGNISQITNCVFHNNEGKNALYLKAGKFNHNTVAYNVGGVYIATATKKTEVCNNVVWSNATDNTGATPTSIAAGTTTGVLALNNYTYNPIPTDKGWILSKDEAVVNTNVEFASNKSNADFVVAEGAEAPEGKCLNGPHFMQVPSFIGVVPADLDDKTIFLQELAAVDLHIKGKSALVNAAHDSVMVDGDRDRNNRPQGPKADVGAYELAYYAVVIPAYNSEDGTIANENANELNDTVLTCVANSVLRLFVMNSAMEVPYKVLAIGSNNGGLTYEGDTTDMTAMVDAETWTLDVTVDKTMKLEVEWVAPVVDYVVELSVAAGCEQMGRVEGAGRFAAGSEVEVKAIANEGYKFVKWSDENTDAIRKIVVSENVVLVASFEAVSEGINNAVSNNLRVVNVQGGLVISGLEVGKKVEVYDCNGCVVVAEIAQSERVELALQAGMYIVKQADMRAKAVVK